jgi:hypothetical protein
VLSRKRCRRRILLYLSSRNQKQFFGYHLPTPLLDIVRHPWFRLYCNTRFLPPFTILFKCAKVSTEINRLSIASYVEQWSNFETVPDFTIRSFDLATNGRRFFGCFSRKIIILVIMSNSTNHCSPTAHVFVVKNDILVGAICPSAKRTGLRQNSPFYWH